VLKSCTVCGRLSETNRCAAHAHIGQRTGSTRQYRKARAEVLSTATACWICGAGPRADDPFEADHVVAHLYGGADSVANLQPAHRSCNIRRGAVR
jgi:5-methylcytosine-specific restriction endonuclease McrA